MTPTNYKPTAPALFIGSARHKAELIERLIAAALPTGDPVKLLILGQPGIGKTALAEFATRLLGCDRWHTNAFNGTQLKIEAVEDIARGLHYKDLFGAYRLLRIEEVDTVPTLAQKRLLTLLDELPSYCAVICTSNCKASDLEDRFQSRFIVLQVDPPKNTEIRELIQTHWPAIPPSEITRISTFACGNVRQALLDAQLALAA